MNRLEIIDMASKMIADGKPTAEIVDAIIAALTPEDGDECPVCGICP